MTGGKFPPEQLRRQAAARVAEIARTMGSELPRLGGAMQDEIAETIPELRGDSVILELLRASTQSNVETFLHVLQHNIAIGELLPPSAAVEYARRLAQRGISASALLRAYRIGQNQMLNWGVAEVARTEADQDVALAAAQIFQTMTFAYVDRVAEQLVAEYESERERWLANRNTLRAGLLNSVLAGRDHDLGAVESALGYGLRQHHLGLVVWTAEQAGTPSELRRLEAVVAAIGESVRAAGPALFLPQDSSSAWGWIPLGRNAAKPGIDIDDLRRSIQSTDRGVRVALGRPAAAVPGFRATHQEAQRAHAVAIVAVDTPVTTFDEPGVQICSILARDLDSTRSLVADALGGLAGDDENLAQLRATLLAFLAARSSYVTAAEAMHLHKNTVKYRVDKAIAARGRSLDEDRLNLELALTACRWLGPAVLPRAGRRTRP
ncbi:helix-turn-helix domain-containing protein [Nocardia sp. NPDC024068]|uniref:PucR family transcriptional regulator n=1 Tax=Nocardia sp. NPDC024068 TaxID=3157197 RepID=UPI0033DA92C5